MNQLMETNSMRGTNRRRSAGGFSLIELLTVIAIITLLISILIPSLTAARNSAKKTSTASTLNGIRIALEAFRNDNEREFPATNGYPPSFAHPPIGNYAFAPHLGEFPFLEGKPRAYGAHWLPAMLMGLDLNGFVPRGNVPTSLQNKPSTWYKPTAYQGKALPRAPLYLEPGSVRLTPTQDLPGRRPEQQSLFPNWGAPGSPTDESTMRQLPVIVDAFEQPILYYAANRFASGGVLVARSRTINNTYDRGQPYYFHQDNIGFTGQGVWGTGGTYTGDAGWNFAGGLSSHPIADPGDDVTAVTVESHGQGRSFARYILDKNAYRAQLANNAQPTATTPLKAVNPDSYLLISAGVDGLYGTKDDVTNMPAN